MSAPRLRVTHPRAEPRRATHATTWWGKAWVRAVEESSYAERDLRDARALVRAGAVGQVTVGPGEVVAAVILGDHTWTVSVSLPVLDAGSVDAFVETVAAESGRLAALLAGDLPHALVEHAEEAGVELLASGGELAAACTCDAWVDPCPHALAVLLGVTRLLDADPLVLLHLRGLPRDDLLARLASRTTRPDACDHSRVDPDLGPDLDTGYDAAVRAARILELLDDPHDPPLDHLV